MGCCKLILVASAIAAGTIGRTSAQPVEFGTRRPVPEFKIDLDTNPEERYVEVIRHFNGSIQAFYKEHFEGLLSEPLKALMRGLANKRGPENDELQAEIRGVAKLLNIEEKLLQVVQMIYELQTFMLNIDNITWPQFGVHTDIPVDGVQLPKIGPACTGILALNKADGTVSHARNLDFSPKEFMQSLVYTGIFMRGGKELYRAQMLAAYFHVATAMKAGPNGFSVEENTRFSPDKWESIKMLENLLGGKRPLNGWITRKAIESAPDYESVVQALSSQKMVASMYTIIGGVKKGTILARSPSGVDHQMVLGQQNFECRDDYIIITNFDYFWHDIKEAFDPTAHGGHKLPRRVAAQNLLNKTADLTPQALFSVIDDYYVRATDTIFQAIMNVELGIWNVSLPPLDGHAQSIFVV